MLPRIGPVRDLQGVLDIESHPLDHWVQAETLFDYVANTAAAVPDKPALIYLPAGTLGDTPTIYTYAEFLDLIIRAASLLQSLDVGPADTVSLVMPNSPEMLIAFFAATAIGRVNLINPFLEARHVGAIMNLVRTKVVVSGGGDIGAKAETACRDVPTVRQILHVDTVGGCPDPDRDLSQLLRLGDKGRVHPCERSRATPAAYFHTGGTTGLPKIAPMTHGNQVYAAWAIGAVAGLGPDDTVMSGLPWFHGGGLFINSVAPLAYGATVVALGGAGFRSKQTVMEFWQLVERFRATFFLAVPTVFAALLESPVGTADISSLRMTCCGGAPLSRVTHRLYEAHVGAELLEGYGMTEAGVSSVRNPAGSRRVGSVGIRYPYQQVRTVVLDQHRRLMRECETGETGTVALGGPNVFPGYLDAHHNADLWIADGLMNTGDVGRLDADGFLWLVGRSKDLIIRGGHNIDPRLIEDAMLEHQAVSDAAAVGQPDPRLGERPVVYVTLASEAGHVSSAELREHAASAISERAAVPSEVLIVDRLPITDVGKVAKADLRRDAASRAVADAVSGIVAEICDPVVETTLIDGVTVAVVRIAGIGPADRERIAREVEARVSGFTMPVEVAFT